MIRNRDRERSLKVTLSLIFPNIFNSCKVEYIRQRRMEYRLNGEIVRRIEATDTRSFENLTFSCNDVIEVKGYWKENLDFRFYYKVGTESFTLEAKINGVYVELPFPVNFVGDINVFRIPSHNDFTKLKKKYH